MLGNSNSNGKLRARNVRQWQRQKQARTVQGKETRG